jgi:DNA polymerase/3'-5' exonuclease PolX
MARANASVAALLEEYADLLAITGGDAFRARTYEKAARSVAGHHDDIVGLDVKALQQIPGVGASIAEKIVEYFTTGQVAAIEALRAKIPAGVRAMTVVPGLGPKKAMVLYEELGIASVAELEEAIKEGRLGGLRGFGPKTAENLLHGIELTRAETGRALIDLATGIAEEIVGAISAVAGCERCTYAGSLRRMRETVGDIDVLAAAKDPRPLMAAFVDLPLVGEVIVRGDKKTSIRTRAGIQVDLRVVPGGRCLAGRGRDRGGGLRGPRPGLDPADAAGGPRRSGRRPRRYIADVGDARGHQGRPAHPHNVDRRRVHDGGNDRRRPRPGAEVLRGHRPRQEPADAADDRRQDADAAQAAAGARRRAGRREDGAAARH